MRKSLAVAAGALIILGFATPGLARQNAHTAGSGVVTESAGAPNFYAPFVQALAYVGQGGAVVRAKGFTSITHPGTGLYCLTLGGDSVATPYTAPQVSVEWGRSLGVALFAQWNYANTDCPKATAYTIEVETYKGDTSGVGSSLQVPVLSDSVAFTILVP